MKISDRHPGHLELSQEIGRLLALSPQTGLDLSLALLQERLALSHVALYGWNEEATEFIRQQTAGEALLRESATIPAGDGSLIGQAVVANGREDRPPQLSENRRQAALPLLAGGQFIGVLALHHRQPACFADADLPFLQALADQLAQVVANHNLAAQMETQLAQLETINRINQVLSLAPHLRAIFAGVRREVLSLVNATGMSISLLSEDGRMMDWIYGYEYGQEVDLSQIPATPVSQGFSGYVATTRKMLHLNDTNLELRQEIQTRVVGATSNTWLGLPLFVSNELIGVLAVENAENAAAFGRQDVELLSIIAGPVAIAINNQRQYDQIEEVLARQSQHHLQLQTAADVSAAAGSILDPSELMQSAVHLIQERFTLYYVGLFLIDEAAHEAVLHAGTGAAGREMVDADFRLPVGGRSLIGGACSDGEPRIAQDVATATEWKANARLPHTQSELALPLRVRSRIIGALTVQSTQTDQFTPELVSTLQTMGDQIATAIINARLLVQTQASARRQRLLNEVSNRLHRSSDVETIVGTGLRALSEELGGVRVNLTLGRTAAPREEQHD